MPMFRIMLRMEIKQGLEEDFEQTWRSVADTVNRQPANTGQWLLRGDEPGSIYYIVSDWTDEESFRAFERSSAHIEHRRKLHPYRLAGTMTTMHMVHRFAGAGAGAGAV